MSKLSSTELAFWTVLFTLLGFGIIGFHEPAMGAWPLVAGAFSCLCSVFFLYHLLTRRW